MTSPERGFTIIEVILFLAITGALFAALMVGVNVGITQQRYSDGVRSYVALMQDQYAAVLNPRNTSDDRSGCAAATGTAKGASDCVILGRLIESDETEVTVSNVYGTEPGTDVSDLGDIEAIAKYNPTIVPPNASDDQKKAYDLAVTQLDWQATLKSAMPTQIGQGSHTAILILRSPASGLVKVFTAYTSGASVTAYDNAKTLISDMLTPTANPTSTMVTNYTKTVTDCVDGDSGALPKQLVAINPLVASADGVSTAVGNGGCSS